MEKFVNMIKIVRRIKGGHWVKTEKRGWIELGTYIEYLDNGFDPIKIKEDCYCNPD